MKRWTARGLPRYQARPRGKVLIRLGDIEQFLTRQQTHKPDLDALVNETLAELEEKQKQKGMKAVTQIMD